MKLQSHNEKITRFAVIAPDGTVLGAGRTPVRAFDSCVTMLVTTHGVHFSVPAAHLEVVVTDRAKGEIFEASGTVTMGGSVYRTDRQPWDR